MRRIPLQVVLALSFVLVATAAIAFFGGLRYFWVTGGLLEEDLNQDRALAKAVATSIERYVANRRHLVDAVAAELAATSLADPAALQALVETVWRHERAFLTFGVAGRDGTALAMAPARDIDGTATAGRRYGDRLWFREIARDGRQQSYDVVIGDASNRLLVAVAAAIRSPRGELKGVAYGGLDLDQLRSSMREIDPRAGDRLVLADASGRVIAHFSRPWEVVARDLSAEEVFLVSRRSAEGTAAYRSQSTGKQTWSAYVRVPSTGWVVWSNRGSEMGDAKLAALVQDLVVSGFAALGLSALAALFLSRGLSRPLRALADATRGVSARRLTLDAVERYRDSRIAEFSQLVSAFRDMAGSMGAQYEDLESKVAERTQALAQQTRDAHAAAAALRVQEQIRRGYGELAELLNSLDRSHILEHGTAKIAASLDVPLAAVYLADNGPETLRLKTYVVVDPNALGTPPFSAAGLPHEVARRRATVILTVPEGERVMLGTGVGAMPVAAVAGFPLLYQDRLLGVLVVATLTPLPEHARGFLENAARQLSVALNNAGLFESVRYQSQQLEHLNAALKRASEVKSEFLASMSHELRTPMNSIIGFTEILLMGGRDQLAPRHRSALEKVLESGRHLLGLINDILDLSKIEAGRMEVHPEALNVRAVAQECLSAVEPQARAKALRLDLGEVDPALTIHQDKGKLKQIVLNLLSNAVKFTSEGRVGLQVEAVEDEIAIAVTDTGLGISPQDQERIFEPFQQGDSSRSRSFGGTGLGLAISRRLAGIMGGTLTFQSELGRGSVFTLRLPRRHVAAPGPKAEPPASASASSGSDGVLVIDDDRNVFEIIRQAVADEPFTVGWASTASSGLAEARAGRPAAILLDVVLQGQEDGWDVLHALKTDPQTRHIPVVIHSIINNPHRARELGADEVLVKPIPAAEIKALLRGYLIGTGGSQPEAIDHER